MVYREWECIKRGTTGMLMEGDFIKRAALCFCALIIVTAVVFSGCGKVGLSTAEGETPFAIYREFDGLTVKLGDDRKSAEKSLGPDEQILIEFEEFNTERASYWDTEGIQLDFDTSGKVFGIWLSAEGWKLSNGLVIGNTVEDIKTVYSESQLFQYENVDDFWVSYDADGNVKDYSRESPYIIRFSIEEGKIHTVVIMDASYDLFQSYF